MEPSGDQARNMRHIHKQIGSDFLGDFSKPVELDLARIGRRPRNDQLGLALFRDLEYLVIVDITGFLIHAVRHKMVVLARQVDRGTVGEMSAMRKVHAHDRIPGLDQREIDRHIRLCARMRLDIGVSSAENLLCALNRDVFHHVNAFAAAIIPLAGIALCVFIGQDSAHRRHDRLADDVFRRDQLQIAALTSTLFFNRAADLRIVFADEFHPFVHHKKFLLTRFSVRYIRPASYGMGLSYDGLRSLSMPQHHFICVLGLRAPHGPAHLRPLRSPPR